MNTLVPGAPSPLYAMPEIVSCEGCLFYAELRTGERCASAKQSWRLNPRVNCVINGTIFIAATSEAVIAYQAAFDTHQLKLIIERLTK